MEPNARRTLINWERKLFEAPSRPMTHDAWAHDVPLSAGVYMVRDIHTRVPVYVGETCCLRDRMKDAGRTVNHSFRRKARVKLGLEAADDPTLSKAMSMNYAVSFIETSFGRAEFEEYLRVRWRHTLTNGPAKRLLRSLQYLWIEAGDAAQIPPITPGDSNEPGRSSN